MVDGMEAGLPVVPHTLGDGIGEKRSNLRVVCEIHGAAVQKAAAAEINKRGVEFAAGQHGTDALVLGNVLETHAFGRPEAGCGAMAEFLGALHVPVHVPSTHSELVLEDAPDPESRGLLIFGHSYPLSP